MLNMKMAAKKLMKKKPSLDEVPSEISQAIEKIANSGLFDEEWYLQSNPDVAETGVVPLEHFYFNGFKEGRSPSYLFDSAWYLATYQDVADAQMNPLEHYLGHGELEGRQPSPFFNPEEYRTKLGLDESQSALHHYYYNAKSPLASPIDWFDPSFYLNAYPDVAEAELDPLKHFMLQGYLEGRNPHAEFDNVWYAETYLDGDLSRHSLYHYLTKGSAQNYQTKAPEVIPAEAEVPNTVASVQSNDEESYLKPGSGFEEFKYGSRTFDPEVKAIAYYLPQFHPFKENNEWWGEGFTEWTNVTRGQSRFVGHYQPHLPRDLGFYDLRLKETLAAQAEMARNAGLEGFCFYHYWFNGKRLMDGPANMLLDNEDIELPFCLMWANENWTRTWDGFENDVLIAQDYRDEDDEIFVADIARHFSDERYIKIDGRPLFFIYRPGIIPDAKEKIKLWRKLFNENHDFDPIIYMAQAFDDIDPRKYGLDGAIEFPPHKVAAGLDSKAQQCGLKDESFTGHYPLYSEMVERSIDDVDFDYNVIKAVTPMWDNEARKPGKGMGFIGSTPEKYEKWLKSVVNFSKNNPIEGKHHFVAINAWNEWAEGAHLEPDCHWGSAYLNATYRALNDVSEVKGKYPLVLIGHDAYKHGAQLLTLNILKTLKQQFGVDVKLVILGEGPLVEEYQKVAETFVCYNDLNVFEETIKTLKEEYGVSRAISNTTVSGRGAKILHDNGYEFVSLIHELKNLISEYQLEDAAKDIAAYSKKVIFAAKAVEDSFVSVVDDVNHEKLIIHPQGIYQTLNKTSNARNELRTRLGLSDSAKIITNVGFADLRKGFDIFVNVAKVLVGQDSDYHFLWIGDIEQNLKHWLKSDMESSLLKDNFHNISFTNEISLYLEGSDCFAMTSREDPFPSVVMESLALGIPVVGFNGGGGFVELLEDPLNGEAVAMASIDEMAAAIKKQITGNTSKKSAKRSQAAVDRFKWDDYVFSLLEYLDPSIKRVSVVVPNYNYQDHISERLRSVFDQAYPVYEVVVLDDLSPDNSVEVIKNYAESRSRKIELVVNKKNSGSVFKQWKKGADLARGEYLWIAEADDSADSEFLSKILAGDNDFNLAYADSVQIDENNKHLADDYRYYYDKGLIEKLDRSGVYSGPEVIEDCLAVKNQFMNVSAILFNAESAKQCLSNHLDEILNFKVAGDWYVYVQMLSQKGSKAKIIGESLNVHRRHSGSVTRQNYDVQLKEISSIHEDALGICKGDSSLKELQSDYLVEVKKVLEG